MSDLEDWEREAIDEKAATVGEELWAAVIPGALTVLLLENGTLDQQKFAITIMALVRRVNEMTVAAAPEDARAFMAAMTKAGEANVQERITKLLAEVKP